MRQRLFCLLVLGLLSLCVSHVTGTATAAPSTTPEDEATNVNTQCILDGLSFSNGISLVPSFDPTIFHYQCSCAWNENNFITSEENNRQEQLKRAALCLLSCSFVCACVSPLCLPFSAAYPSPLTVKSHVNVMLNGKKINDVSNKNGISIGGRIANAPETHSSDMKLASGSNIIKIGVGCEGGSCYYEYTISCYKPPDGFIIGDPQFVGLRGQSYQVHGVSGEIYNIVSDSDLQYNSRFVFLNSGECPVVDGVKQRGCFSHPGSYLGELGLKTSAGDRIHLQTGSARDGFKSVSVNGHELDIGETVILAENMGTVSRNSTHLAAVAVGVWDFAFENSDHFLNQRVRVTDSRGLRSHGLLGQTWRETTYPNSIKYVQGVVDDYVIREHDIFGDSFLYNAFN